MAVVSCQLQLQLQVHRTPCHRAQSVRACRLANPKGHALLAVSHHNTVHLNDLSERVPITQSEGVGQPLGRRVASPPVGKTGQGEGNCEVPWPVSLSGFPQ